MQALLNFFTERVVIHKWTSENQQMWRLRLKQLIKDSSQTQVEVARSMANIVGVLEATTVSQNAFVAPLSRFVNAKGNEIDRWFEQEDARLGPLSTALGLSSSDMLIRLRKEILFGEGEHPIHPLFPMIKWEVDWVIEGQVADENSVVMGSCDLTHRLISLQVPGIQRSIHTHFSNVDLPTWDAVISQLESHLSPIQSRRLAILPGSLWSNMGLQFGDALSVLHTLLYREACWSDNQLTMDWVKVVQGDWVDRRIVKICTNVFKLSDDQCAILWSSIQHCLNQASSEQLILGLKDALSVDTETDFDPKWAVELKSSSASVVNHAIEKIETWISQVPSEKIVRYLHEQRLLTVVDERLAFQSPIDACCMAGLVLQSPNVDPYHSIWWSALWWAIQSHDWSDIYSVLRDLEPWETSSALCFVLSEVEEEYLTIEKGYVALGTIHWQRLEVQSAVSTVLLKQYSGCFELMTLFGGMSLLHRLHRLSERLIDCLPLWSDWQDLSQLRAWKFPMANPQPLVYWAPYQVSIYTMKRWEALQTQASVPLWKVLEVHAQKGSVESAKLLAQGEDLGSEIWTSVPVHVRLSWLSKVPPSRKTLYLFQTMLVDYWQQPQPKLEFVLDIGRAIGFDTVLSWMQGWVNPLFLAQQESGLILGRVSFQFAEHFNRIDLIETWTRMLWNWLRDKDSIQEGFIRWNSRRVPIAKHNIEVLIESVSELLELGLTLHPQPTLLNHVTLELDFHLRTNCPPVQYMAVSKILRRWKREQLIQGNEFFLQNWLDQTPKVDLEVERAILENPDLLDKIWRLDRDGARRSEILRLAGLVRPVPTWAIALANRGVSETGYWPTWLSPHAKEAVGLLPMMIEPSEGVHRLWWLKVYSQHGEVSVAVWRTMQTWLQSTSWRTEPLQTVHFLGPNQTPRMTFGDVLSWILTLYQRSPLQLQSNPAREVMHHLRNIYATSLSALSVAEFFALMAILSRNNFQRTLWSIDILQEHWALMSSELQRTYRNHWIQNNHDITDCTLPIVGDWVLEYAILHDHPHAYEFLVARMHDGNLDGLNTLLHAPKFELKLMKLFDLCLASNPAQRSHVQEWILARPIVLQHRNPDWQRWVRQVVIM